MISVCGLPLGVFLAFYERERLQSGLGLASFLCFAIFFEFGEPEPGWVGLPLIATRCGCVETLLRLVKPAMPVIWPAWILCSLLHRSFSVQSQVCLGTRRMSSDARRINRSASAQKPRCRDSRQPCRSAPAGVDKGSQKGFATLLATPKLGWRSREASRRALARPTRLSLDKP